MISIFTLMYNDLKLISFILVLVFDSVLILFDPFNFKGTYTIYFSSSFCIINQKP